MAKRDTMPSATAQAKAAILFAVAGIVVNALSNFLLQQTTGVWVTIVSIVQFVAVPALAITAISLAVIVIRAANREHQNDGKGLAIFAIVLAALVLIPWVLLSVLYVLAHSQG